MKTIDKIILCNFEYIKIGFLECFFQNVYSHIAKS